MPPKIKVTKESILSAGLSLVRRDGYGALNARTIAKELGCSTQPLFSNYATMEELSQDILAAAEAFYRKYLSDGIARKEYPPYKASGVYYIRFAKEEPELFKLLFMRDRTKESGQAKAAAKGNEDIRQLICIVASNTGLAYADAELFHWHMWVFVHGIATMLATKYQDWDEQTISTMLTNAYLGLKEHYPNNKEENNKEENPLLAMGSHFPSENNKEENPLLAMGSHFPSENKED